MGFKKEVEEQIKQNERIYYSEEQIKKMEDYELLATLDDVVQYNLLKMDNLEYMKMKKFTYNRIMAELGSRLVK